MLFRSSHAGTAEFLRNMEVPKHYFRQWQMALHDSARDAYFGVRSVSGWGMTEMVIPAICSDLSLEQTERTIGRPYSGYTVRIEHDNGEHVAPGENGQLLIGAVRGLHIFQEYVGNAKAMAEAFDEIGRAHV